MPTPSSLYDMADRLAGGDLETRLRNWRNDGETFAEIAFRLRGDGVTVTHETVRNWCITLGIHEPVTGGAA